MRIVSIRTFGVGCAYSFEGAVEILKDDGLIDPDTDWLLWDPDYKSRKARKKPKETSNGQ